MDVTPVKDKLTLIDGTVLANEYNRVVHGGRGPYIELTYEQILPKLYYRFDGPFDIKNVNRRVDFYYYWLEPEGSECKIYYQLKTVKYADYKIGLFYISPSLVKDFHDPEELNFQ